MKEPRTPVALNLPDRSLEHNGIPFALRSDRGERLEGQTVLRDTSLREAPQNERGLYWHFCRVGLVLVVFAAILASSACREDVVVQEGLTGIELTVTYDIELDQLAIDVTPATKETIDLAPVPERPRQLSPDGESVVILLDDEHGNEEATVRVRGFARGVPAGAGLTVVMLRRQALVPASVHLGAPAICGDESVIEGFEECDDGDTLDDDGCSSLCTVEEGWACDGNEPSECRLECGATTCEDGQHCVDGECLCDATSCPDGCCTGGRCLEPTFDQCGLLGRACVACNELRSEACSVDGYCTCGLEAECAPGERCDNGMCVCDGLSCAGCCSENGCERRSFELCGVDGATCVTCDSRYANTCTPEGACKCGSNDPCLQGQRCISGNCFCDDVSCPDGCCAFDQCLTPSLGACGTRGGACASCDEEKADRCLADGTCSCGGGPPCRDGQRCVDGACTCDFESCPDGCCYESTCVSPTREHCGAYGLECAVCDPLRADECSSNGECRCGETAECAEGQHCVGGSCVCDWITCAGCCDATDQCRPGDDVEECGRGGTLCEACTSPELCDEGICSGCNEATCSGCCGPTCRTTHEFPICGDGGDPCTTCDEIRSNGCTDGACSCSGNDQCNIGQQCIAGACVCNDISCPAGCCQDNECQDREAETCGIAGASCVACDPVRANSCSASGECRCGTGPSCEEGQRCVDDSCVCDAESCTDGCCRNGLCEPFSSVTCGSPGTTCRPCDVQRSDGCSAAGACLCGDGPACDEGQHCFSGVCLCDGSSCSGCCRDEECLLIWSREECGSGGGLCEECVATETCIGGSCTSCEAECSDGCCSGNTCRVPDRLYCGAAGEPCVACDLIEADRCVDGECRCGDGPTCGDGQHCLLGSCVCDDESCPLGCCSGDICRALSMTRCAPSGEECQACDATAADNCSPWGDCRCGSGPTCGVGLECVEGSCL